MSDFRMETLCLGMVQTNCYLVWNEDTMDAFLVDPADQPMMILEAVRRGGLNVKAILLTHGHFDHMMAVPELKKLLNVEVYAGEAERLILLDGYANLSASWGGNSVTFEADHYVKDQEEFELAGFKIRVIATPGHTCGGVCYYLYEEGQLFAGDTLFRGSYGRTDLETGNTAVLMKSIREKLLILPPETNVYPGHSLDTTIGYERKRNPMARGLVF